MENKFNCLVCNIDLPNDKFDECYTCFNRYMEALATVEWKYKVNGIEETYNGYN
jgi:hypothetical protein